MVRSWGPPEDMSFEDVADKQPSLEDVLVDVRAVGVNFFDALVIEGKYQVRPAVSIHPRRGGIGRRPQRSPGRTGTTGGPDRIPFPVRLGHIRRAE